METLDDKFIKPTGKVFTQRAVEHLRAVYKWTQFISILGFVQAATSIFFWLFQFNVSSVLSTVSGFISSLLLYKFSIHLGHYTDGMLPYDIKLAFKKQRIYYRFLGILIIVGISLILLLIGIGGTTASITGR